MSTDILDREEWKRLIEEQGEPCLSLLMPTHRFGVEMQQDPVRLKNLLRQAEIRLAEEGVATERVASLLAPARELLEDGEFWQHLSDGLALFATPELFRTYRVPLTLPEQVVLAERFYVKPLLPLRLSTGRYYILALSLNQVRLLVATREEVRRLSVPGMPESFEAAMGVDEFYSGIQGHTSHSSRLGGRTAIFHGHGDNDEEHLRADIRQYFRQVATSLERHLKDQNAPLLLATVESHLPLYREVHHRPELLPEILGGNPDTLSDHELQARAWPLAEPFFLRERDEAWQRFAALAGSERTSYELDSILPAAHQGRVELLFLADNGEVWGSYDRVNHKVVVVEKGSEDLLNTAAVETLRHGGSLSFLVYK